MAKTKITCVNGVYTIVCSTYHMEEFLEEMKKKFSHSFYHEKGAFNAYFSFPFSLSLQHYEHLFDFCDEYDILVLGIVKEENNQEMTLLQACFHSGETYEIRNDTVYVGDIDQDVYISAGCNLYVVGQIRGKIDMLYQNLEVGASSFSQAKVRIFDTPFQNVTKLAPCKVYYEGEEMKVD